MKIFDGNRNLLVKAEKSVSLRFVPFKLFSSSLLIQARFVINPLITNIPLRILPDPNIIPTAIELNKFPPIHGLTRPKSNRALVINLKAQCHSNRPKTH